MLSCSLLYIESDLKQSLEAVEKKNKALILQVEQFKKRGSKT